MTIQPTADSDILPARQTGSPGVAAADRVVSIDCYRGMVMFLMLAELMHLDRLADHFPGHRWLEWLQFHTTHVAWEGCSLHDLIQPGFTFLVGVAMPFSIASRMRKGNSSGGLLLHACWRAFVLVAIGIVLRSLGQDQTNFTFEDTLTQIGLGYPIAFAVALMPRMIQFASLAVVLIGFWGLYALLPAPPDQFDYAAVGVPADWPHHHDGFASRWNKNSNVSWRFDTWFMNLFPRESTYLYNGGGYVTLSFIPTLGTMLIGLLAGNWFREVPTFSGRIRRLLAAAVIGIASGWLLAVTDVCPLVKRIWTPSFTLYSGGLCLLWLAALHVLCDRLKFQRWAYPFIVIGANSILIYVMSWTVADPLRDLLVRHLGERTFAIFGDGLSATLSGAATLLVLFGVLLWLYRRRIFIKI